jgi:DNA invertase Pin-like site-specific DNA recombinase
MIKIGYARTSTIDQVAGLEAQIRDLKSLGCKKIFQEQLSSVDHARPQLEAAIDYCRDGDVLVCTKLDRLARSVADVVTIEKRLRERDATLQILDPAMDTSTPNGRLMFNVIASVAQFEREVMLQRQREGIAKARGEGKYTGRQPTARNRVGRVIELFNAGLKPDEIAAKVSAEKNGKGKPQPISLASVYRLLADARREGKLGEVKRIVLAAQGLPIP